MCENQLGLFPGNQPFGGGTEYRDYNFDITHPVVVHSSVAERITPIFRVHFNGGGRDFQPTVAGLVHWVVATSPTYNDKPAFTTTMFGRGRVFLTTAHPERSYYPQSHPVVILAAEWGLGRTNPPDDQPPKIQADIPVAGRPGEPLRFSGAGSDDPDGYPIGFIWDFDDGSAPAYRPEHTHKYACSGTYAVTLTVTDGQNDAAHVGRIVIAGAP